MKIVDLIAALRPRSGLSQAQLRAKETEKLMKKLLKSDLETFKKGLREMGLKDSDEEFKKALRIYDETS